MRFKLTFRLWKRMKNNYMTSLIFWLQSQEKESRKFHLKQFLKSIAWRLKNDLQNHFKKSVDKELSIIPTRFKVEILTTISELAEQPRPSGYKKLKGKLRNFYRIRSGDYRIIYAIDDSIRIVGIRRIAHRKDVYEIWE